MPERRSVGGNPVGSLQSTPESRSGAVGGLRLRSLVERELITILPDGTIIDGDGNVIPPGELAARDNVRVGESAENAGADKLKEDLTKESNTTAAGPGEDLTVAEKEANREAAKRRKEGILGCTGKAIAPDGPECGDCGPVDCLKDLLRQMLPQLPADARGLLCNLAGAAEKAAKRQLDNAGNNLLNAATDLAAADALKAPLSELDKFFGTLDPGAIANCFGAQELVDKVRGELNRVNNVISDVEAGVQDRIAETFQKGLAATQQWSLTGGLCP